jgi:uncharacterized membrane protein
MKEREFIQKNRLEAFSDGVFAILITLLVLEIKVPHIEQHNSTGALQAALQSLLPKFLSWVISFLVIAVIWVNHHRILERVEKADHSFFWLNTNLLLWTSFIPFPTALMGDYAHNPLAVSLFGIVLSLSALAFTFLRKYLADHGDLLKKEIGPHVLKHTVLKSFLLGPLAYGMGAAAAWIHTGVSWAIYLIIPLYFIFPSIKHKTA